jgi:PAS domain S-box-containing protein
VSRVSKGPPKANTLRKTAENQLKRGETEAATPDIAGQDPASLLHELQIHQIELEMQNEELRRAQVELEASRKKYTDLFDYAPVGYLVLDLDGTVLEANLTLARRLGVERTGLIGKPFQRHVAPENRDDYYLLLRRTLQSGLEQTCEIKLLPSSGGEYHAQLNSMVLENSANRRWCHVSLTDITGCKEIETALRDSSQLLEKTFISLRDAALVIGLPAGVILTCNPSAERTFGFSAQEMIGHSTEILYADRQGNQELQKILSALPGNELYRGEHTLFRKDGTAILTELTATEMLDNADQRSGFVVVVRDITEHKMLEEQLRRTTKLEATGLLAGGIAHDFNNLLSVILLNLGIAQLEVESDNPAFQALTVATDAAVRASELTKRFITFATGGTPLRRPCSVKELLLDCLARTLHGSAVEYEYELPDNLWLVEMDRVQMSQAIRNVLSNARESMPDGGVIEVAGENVQAPPLNQLPDTMMKVGPYVKISITDHGAGIPAEILDKIFDPYFSTKTRGAQKGLGLGLTAAHSIIQKHNGLITVNSETGVGTVIDIYLPACGRT